MITRKLQLLLLILMVSLSTTVTAQKIIKKANKQFELRAYDKAYDTYVKALEKYPERNVLKLQIAECLRRTNKVLESKEWYEIAMASTDVPVVYNLYYGHLLKNIAEYRRLAQLSGISGFPSMVLSCSLQNETAYHAIAINYSHPQAMFDAIRQHLSI